MCLAPYSAISLPSTSGVWKTSGANEDDGPLLRLLESVCDVFVTVDRNIPFQQRLEHRSFATMVLLARSNRLADLLPLVPHLINLVTQAAPGPVSSIAG